MPINILMPALSPTMEKGNLAKWLKKEGDKVKSGDVIAEIETDKATMEVEAVDEGTIAKIVVPEGTQDVAVNDVIAVMAGDGEDVKAAGAAQPQKAEAKPGAKAEPKQEAKAEAPKQDAAPAEAPRHRRRRQLPPRKAMVTTARSRRRSPAASPRKPASNSRASTVPARMAASSRATSRGRNPARG